VVETAERTIDRIEAFGAADGDAAADEYATMAETQYGAELSTYRDAVVSALETLESEDDAEAVGAEA